MGKQRLGKSQIFDAVAEAENPLQRARLLTDLCGDDLELRREIEELLAREQALGSFLDSGQAKFRDQPPGTAPTAGWSDDLSAPSGRPGKVLGPYRLVQALGAGGMGEVWAAEQLEPVKRQVALKLIRKGVGSREIIARFEAERQALALMNHPNIARILDAGTSADGQPYFVMELVAGKPLTTWCDENRLSIDERLKLFMDVCSGVQHAHQKGIIHRDLKPGNIIVGMADGAAVPKIIDFGLAKAMETTQRLSDHSLFTGIGQVLGTLRYMSPEQASLDNQDIDTRADIYALGVILYELLTGSTPLDGSSIRGQAALKVLEYIRDKDPVKPSSRLLSSSDEQVSSITGQRKTDSVRLKRVLLGDLDWIVMKALEKDRARRYESASGFAADIRRYLNSEPVVARPPSLNYQVRKFVRKNRGLVAAAGTLAASLVLGILGTSWGMWTAVEARRAQSAALERESLQRKEAERARERAETNESTARKQSQIALSTLATVVSDIQGGLKNLSGSGEVRRRLLQTSLEKLEDVATPYLEQTAIDYETMNALTELGDMVLQFGQSAAIDSTAAPDAEQVVPLRLAQSIHSRAHQIATQLVRAKPDDIEFQRSLAVTHQKKGDVASRMGDNDEALVQNRSALELFQAVAVADPDGNNRFRDIAGALNHIGATFNAMGKSGEALASFQEAQRQLTRQIELTPGGDPELQSDQARVGINIANVLMDSGKPQDAIETMRSSIRTFEVLRDRHPENTSFRAALARTRADLGSVFSQVGRLTEALAEVRESRKTWEELAADDPANLDIRSQLAHCLTGLAGLRAEMGDLDAAGLAYSESLTIARQLMQADTSNSVFLRATVNALCGLGDVNLANGNALQADANYEEALNLSSDAAGAFSSHASALRERSTVIERMATMHLAAGELDEAANAFQQMFDIKLELAEADPGSLPAQDELASARVELGNVRLAQNQLDLAAAEFEKSLAILEQVRQSDPDYLRASVGIAIAHERLANVEVARGNLSAAIGHWEQKLAQDLENVARNPAAIEPRRNVAVSQASLGYLYLKTGSTEGASSAFQAALDVREKMATDQPANLRLQADLSLGWQNQGDVLLALGEIPDAFQAYEQSLKISQQIVTQDTENLSAQQGHSITLERIGTILQRRGELEKARECFERKLANDEAMVARWPRHRGLQRELSYAYRKLGDLDIATGQLAEAERRFRENLRLCSAIAAEAPDDPVSMRDLSTAYERMGNLALAGSNAATALEYYSDMLEIKRRISGQDPTNQAAAGEVSIALVHIGQARQVLGELDQAIEAYRESLAIGRARTAGDPANFEAQRDQLALFDHLSVVLSAVGESEEALALARERLELSKSLATRVPGDATAARDLLSGHGVLASVLRDAGQAPAALRELRKALKIGQQLQADKKFVGEIDSLVELLNADIAAIQKSLTR